MGEIGENGLVFLPSFGVYDASLFSFSLSLFPSLLPLSLSALRMC